MFLPWRRRSLEAGKVNFVFVIGFLVCLVVGYFVVVYAGPWSRNRRVDQVMREAAYQAWRNKEDAPLRDMIMQRKEKFFPKAKADGRTPQFEATDILIERDPETKKIYLDLAYTVIIDFPIVNKEKEVTYELHVVGDTIPPTQEDKKKSEWMKWLTE